MPPARPKRKTSRSSFGKVSFAAALLGLLALTAWNVTYSTADDEALRAYSVGDLPRALQYALDHLSARPWSRQAALIAANCLSRMDYSEEAERYYRRAGTLSLADWQIRAYGLVRGPHPERAIPVYHQILARWPDNITAMRRLAAALIAEDKMAEAEALSRRLLATPGGAVIGETLRAFVYHNDHNHQKAAAAFERILELDPELGAMPMSRDIFWAQFTDDLISSGRLVEAREALRKYLVKHPDANLMNRLGQVYLLEGSLDDAERSYLQAVELNPNEFGPHLNLARLALQRHDPKAALTHIKQAKQLAPRKYSVLYSLESIFRQLGETAEADRLQQELKRLRSEAAAPPTIRKWRVYEL